MPTLDDVYRKFGEAAEAAQILETSVGNELIFSRAIAADLLDQTNATAAQTIFSSVNRATLGQLLKEARNDNSLDEIVHLLDAALKERNRLFHSFYRQHNFRRNSDEGRALMLQDLELVHNTIVKALNSWLKLVNGVDVETEPEISPPTRHLPI